MSLADNRRSYDKSALHESMLDTSPFRLFGQWMDEAIAANITDPTAMTLATTNANGQPSARIVLLKDFDEQGFVFYSNYESRKGQDLNSNPQAALLFYWSGMERQVRIEGKVTRLAPEDSDAYFHSRPLTSQLSAWASPQSQPTTRETLTAQFQHYQQTLGDHPQRPDFWGGYRIHPHHIEFWQGRASRLHDRFVYQLNSNHQWSWVRLAP